MRPEAFDKAPEPGHALGVKPVVPVPSFFAGCYQPGLLQQQQMLGHSRTAHREMCGQLADRLFLARQKMQKTAPVWLRGNF